MEYIKKTIKDLEKYYRLKFKAIPNLENRINVKEYELVGVGALQYEGMPGQTGSKKINYRKEKLIQEKTELEERLKINKAFVDYMDEALIKLNNIDKEILIECYGKDKFLRKPDSVLCKELNISNSSLYRKKKELIEEFTKDLFGI